jgi:hypothetical protein
MGTRSGIVVFGGNSLAMRNSDDSGKKPFEEDQHELQIP